MNEAQCTEFVRCYQERKYRFEVTAFDVCCRFLNDDIEKHKPDLLTLKRVLPFVFKQHELSCVTDNPEVHPLLREAALHWIEHGL